MSKPHIRYFNVAMIPIHFGFTTSKAAFRREMKRLGVTEPDDHILHGADGTTHSFTREGENTTVIVCMRRGKDLQNIALAVHEAVHVWQHAKQALYCGDDDEIMAFSIQYFAEVLLHELGIR